MVRLEEDDLLSNCQCGQPVCFIVLLCRSCCRASMLPQRCVSWLPRGWQRSSQVMYPAVHLCVWPCKWCSWATFPLQCSSMHAQTPSDGNLPPLYLRSASMFSWCETLGGKGGESDPFHRKECRASASRSSCTAAS